MKHVLIHSWKILSLEVSRVCEKGEASEHLGGGLKQVYTSLKMESELKSSQSVCLPEHLISHLLKHGSRRVDDQVNCAKLMSW